VRAWARRGGGERAAGARLHARRRAGGAAGCVVTAAPCGTTAAARRVAARWRGAAMTDRDAHGHLELGGRREFDIIRAMLGVWGPHAHGIGDDAAVLSVPPMHRL